MKDRWLDGKAYFEHVKRAWGPPVWLEWLEHLRQKAIEKCGIPASMMRNDMTDIERCACEERVCSECRCNRRTGSMYRMCTCDTIGHDIGCARNKCPVCDKTCRQYVAHDADRVLKITWSDEVSKTSHVNLCPSADGAGSVCCKKCEAACWKARPDLVCPRCGGLVARFDTSHPGKCVECNWPGLKQRADVCRHPRLRVQLNGEVAECLTPGCKAKFRSAWQMNWARLRTCAGRILLRYDDALLLPPDAFDWWLFPVIGEAEAQASSVMEYSMHCHTLKLINDDEVEIPEGGWVKQKVVKREDQAKETYKISYGERSPVKRVNNMEEAKAAFSRPPAMTKSDVIAFAEDYIRAQFGKYCTVTLAEAIGSATCTIYCAGPYTLSMRELLELRTALRSAVPMGVQVFVASADGKPCGTYGCTKAIPKDWHHCSECRDIE